MALIPIMTARITTGIVNSTISARAFVTAKPVLTSSSNVHRTRFSHKDNEADTQDTQLARSVHTFNSKSNNLLSVKGFHSPPIGTRHIILVCHGQQQNLQHENAGLTFWGREQASLTGRRLLEMDLPINKIVHNGQCHTVETSDMIASYLPDTPQEVDISLKDNQQESVEQAVKKYLSVDPSKQSDDSYDLVVCDEDMIKRLISRARKLNSVEASLKLPLHHASVSELAVHPDGQISVRPLDDPVCLNPSP